MSSTPHTELDVPVASVLIDSLDTNYLIDKWYELRQVTNRKYRWNISLEDKLHVVIAFILLRHLSIKRTDSRVHCPKCKEKLLINIYTIRKSKRENKNNYLYKIHYCFHCNKQTIFYTFESDAFRLSTLMTLDKNDLNNLILSSNERLIDKKNTTILNKILYFISDENLNMVKHQINKYANKNTEALINNIKILNTHKVITNILGIINKNKKNISTNKIRSIKEKQTINKLIKEKPIINKKTSSIYVDLDNFNYNTYEEFMDAN